MEHSPLPFPLHPAVIEGACTCFALRRAARNAARRYDAALRTVDITNGQYALLVAVAGLQPVGVQALGDRLGMDRTTVTAALKPLVRRGLVGVAVAETDQRLRDVTLTAGGQAILAQAIPLWQAAQEAIERQIGGPDAAAEVRERLKAVL